MRTEHLEYLVAAARCGSMRQAAKRLYCTQPAISGAVESLENELGFQILERTASGVVPTAKGGMIIDDAEQIVRLIKSWTDEAGNLDEKTVSGDIYAADAGEIGLTFFQDVAMAINKRYPKIIMHLVDPGNILQRINTGRFQIAVLPIVPKHRLAMENYLKRYHWCIETLYDDNYNLLVNCKNPLSRKAYVSLADLNGMNIKLHESFPYRDSLNVLKPTTSIEYDNGIKIITAVSENKAVGIFPPSRDSLVQAFEEAELFRTLSFYDVYFPMQYCLIYWERLPLLAAGSVVIDQMKQSFMK